MKINIVLILLTAVFLMTIGGIVTSQTMARDEEKHGCPFMGAATLCTMSPLQHVSAWQSLFVATSKQLGGLLIVLLALAIVFPIFGQQLLLPLKKVVKRRDRCRERIFGPLRLAFARGVIHAKVF